MSAAPRLILTVDGNELGVERFNRLAADLLDDTPAMLAIQDVMLRSTQRHFAEQGPGWPPLSEATKERRRNEDKGTIRILEDTGYLIQSLTPNEVNSASIRILESHYVAIGTNRPGASNHQLGITVPKREFLRHDPEDVADFKAVYSDWLLGRGPFAAEVG